MSQEREAQIEETLVAQKDMQIPRLLVELLTLRRERHRDKLETAENAEVRGKAKECKDLIQLFD